MSPSSSGQQAAEHLGIELAPALMFAALTQLGEGVILTDAGGRIIMVNDAAARLHGVARLDVAPDEYAATYQLLTEEGEPYPSAELPLARAVLRGETVQNARWQIRRPDGSVVFAVGSARPVLGPGGEQVGSVLTMSDDSPRVEARLATSRATGILERVAFLAEASERLASSLDYETTLRQIVALAVPAVADWALYTVDAGDGMLRIVVSQHVDPAKASFIEETARRYPISADEPAGAARVIRTGESELIEDIPDARLEAVARDAEHLKRLRTVGIRSLMTVPVIAQGHVLGALGFVTGESGRRYRAEDLAFAEELARRAATALDHATLFAEAQRARQEVESERARLRAVILQTPAPLALLVGPEHRFELVNAAYRRISGGGRDITGLTPAEAFPDFAGSGIYELFDQVYESGEPWDGPETLVRYDRDGTGVLDTWFNLRFEPVRDADGRVMAILNFAVDVTEQVLARRSIERHLAESELARTDAESARARSEAVLASIADAFYLVDREWRFTYVNDAAEPLLQTTRDQLLGRTLWEAFPDVAGSPFEAPYRDAMSQGRVTSAEAYFAPLGTWFDVRTYPWTGGLMVHFRDIGTRMAAAAERERLLTDAQAARLEAETANRAKSEFLAVMSHELRTPLNAIGGYAELMELGIQGPVTDAQRTVLGRIQQSQRHLLGLINEVLNYARLETGSVQYEIADVFLHEVLAEAEALVAPQARAKGLTLTLSACSCTRPARADAEKLRQVFVNLLSNAVKFTDARNGQPGRIALSCTTDDGRAIVRVRDTGIGIPAEKLDAIFEPFVQVRADLTRTAEGTGLGLAISRDLARGMHGELTVESTLGEGSVFTLTLPSS